MGSKKRHIDDVQCAKVEEHFKVIIDDKDTIESESFEDLTPTDLPEWYDEELFHDGQEYFRSNLLGITAGSLAGLIGVFVIPSILRILIYTKRSGTPCAAFKRYLETILHARAWYSRDVKDKDSDWYRSMNTVRSKHCNASRQSLREGLGGITHRDMALTQFTFVGYVLLRPEYLGLTNTRKERESFNHFWRVNGHMLGISDRINICRKTEAQTTELCAKLQDEVFAKYLKEVPPNFIETAETMLDGLWSIDFTMDKDAMMALTYKLNGLSYPEKLRLYSWLNLKLRETAHMLCGLPYIGRLFRGCSYYVLELNFWLVERWPVVAWLSYGIKRSKIHLYPNLK